MNPGIIAIIAIIAIIITIKVIIYWRKSSLDSYMERLPNGLIRGKIGSNELISAHNACANFINDKNMVHQCFGGIFDEKEGNVIEVMDNLWPLTRLILTVASKNTDMMIGASRSDARWSLLIGIIRTLYNTEGKLDWLIQRKISRNFDKDFDGFQFACLGRDIKYLIKSSNMDSVEYWLGKFLKLKDGEIGFLFSTYFILKIVGSTKIMYEYPELGTPSGIEKREWSDESWEN